MRRGLPCQILQRFAPPVHPRRPFTPSPLHLVLPIHWTKQRQSKRELLLPAAHFVALGHGAPDNVESRINGFDPRRSILCGVPCGTTTKDAVRPETCDS